MTTTITTAEPELRQQVWEIVTRKGGLDEQSVAILLHGIQHGLTSLDAIESAADLWVLTWSPSWRQPGYTDGPLVAAWEADQRSRSVPLVCPSWCKVEHTKIDADGDVIQPFYESAGHECSLGGKGEVIEAHLVQIQHWASDKARETYVAFYGGDKLVKVDVAEFDAYCEQVIAAIRIARSAWQS